MWVRAMAMMGYCVNKNQGAENCVVSLHFCKTVQMKNNIYTYINISLYLHNIREKGEKEYTQSQLFMLTNSIQWDQEEGRSSNTSILIFKRLFHFIYFISWPAPSDIWNFPNQELNPSLLQQKYSFNQWTTKKVPNILIFITLHFYPF